MKLTIPLLIFASANLSSYCTAATFNETFELATPKNAKLIIGPNPADTEKAANFYTKNNLSPSEAMALASQLSNDIPLTIETPNAGQSIQSSSDHLINGIQVVSPQPEGKTSVITSEPSVHQKASALIQNVPLPAVVWLFLGGLLGILRIQCKRVVS